MRRRLGQLACVVLTLTAAVAATADDGAALIEQQQRVREDLRLLEDRMTRLAQSLAEIEPEQAQRLLDGLAFIGQSRLRERVEDAAALLRQNRLGEAEHVQSQLLADLQTLVERLKSSEPDLDRLRREREALEALVERVDTLAQREGELRHSVEMREDVLREAQALSQLADELDAAAVAQEELQKTSPEDEAARQRELRATAQSAADKAAAAARDPESLAASAEMNVAATEARDAAQAMEKAADALDAGASEDAAEQQNRAAKGLRAAAQRVREQADELQRRADVRQIERLQRETEQETRRLESDVRQQQRRSGALGADALQDAAGAMQAAGDQLSDEETSEALDAQAEALRNLNEAARQLDQALRQVREEERAEALAGVETRLRDLLTRETAVRDVLTALEALSADEWNENQRLRLEQAAEAQRGVIRDAETTLRIVADEGTTIVLPDLLRLVLDDMRAAATTISDQASLSTSRARLADIIAQLEELLQTVMQQRARDAEQRQASSSSSGEGQGALLPASAELKMLRAAQQRVNRRTEELAAGEQVPVDAEEFGRLSQRQGELAELTQRMMERK